ncbi:hypothetical protein OHS33_39295 (plasmid) [Streptomyces sp. NBC_00536]|uniref:hypothetical protein n=1 Tax=Streptomyces sp. NBC_00536 TaxID=2975769 RepID=UPI002E822571|nr:hypothetical protein [Streptomyces sp. NBC_00536]WUC84501.1 hypothetical protein OHS33_39295 [Streptomyces sp. NBC_00536]
MNGLLNIPKRFVRRFHAEHGPMDDWSADEFDQFLELLKVAHLQRGLLGRMRLRLDLLTWTVLAVPLYMAGSLLWSSKRVVLPWLEAAFDRVDDRCTAVETVCLTSGDRRFVERVAAVALRVTDRFDRITDRFDQS